MLDKETVFIEMFPEELPNLPDFISDQLIKCRAHLFRGEVPSNSNIRYKTKVYGTMYLLDKSGGIISRSVDLADSFIEDNSWILFGGNDIPSDPLEPIYMEPI